jgi:hypothetical protein
MDLKSLRKLPRLGQVWFADRRPSEVEILGQGSPDLILWADEEGMIRGFDLVLSPAEAAEAFASSFASAAATPVPGCVPGLPAEVRVLDPEVVASLAGALEPLGIPVSAADENAGLDDAFRSFHRQAARKPGAGYLEMLEGLLPEKKRIVSAFYREAELLHDAKPWSFAEDSDLLRIEGLAERTVLISVMGSAGIEEGIAVFMGEAAAEQFFATGGELRGETCFSLTYSPSDAAPTLAAEARKLRARLAGGGLVPLALTVTDENRFCTLAEMELLTRASQTVRAYFSDSPLPPRIRVEWPVFFQSPGRQRSGTADLFQLRVELRGTEVQRTVVLPSDCTLEDLHEVIQDAMGWEDCHLYGFTVKKKRYGPDEGDLPDDEVELREVLPRVRSKLVYHYDFGDDWIHDVILEKRLKPTDHAPEIDVLAGAGACPPEDCGGIPGYFSMIEALSTPRHPDKAHWREWIGKFDPKKFDLKKAQKRVREGLE